MNDLTSHPVKSCAANNANIYDKKISDSLARLQETNDELLVHMKFCAHDLRAPLRNISNFIHLLLENKSVENDCEVQRSCQIIICNLKKINLFTSTMLAKINTDTDDFSVFSVTDVVDAVRELLWMDLQERNVIINVQDDIPKIYCNYMQTQHIFMNIIDNSIKYANVENLQIDITYKIENTMVIFEIRDNGARSESNDFLRYAKCPEKTGGSGVSLTKFFIEKHGGSFNMIQTQNGGCLVRFSLSIAVE